MPKATSLYGTDVPVSAPFSTNNDAAVRTAFLHAAVPVLCYNERAAATLSPYIATDV